MKSSVLFMALVFGLKTGEVKEPPAYEDVTSFPTRVENGTVQLRDPRWD